MKVIVEISDKDAELIFNELNMDMRKAIEGFVKKATDGLVQVALLKKSGVKIDMEKTIKAGFKLGREVAKEVKNKEES